MSLLTNKAVLLAIKEVTYGVDPGSGYTGILLNKGVTISPTGEKLVRDIISQTYSPQGHVIGVKQTKISFEVEMKGGGLDTGVIQNPEMDVLLQCCGMVRSAGLVMPVDTVAVATFSVGEEVTNTTQLGETVGYVAQYIDNGDDTGTLFLRDVENDPTDGDALAGETSGTTAAADGTPSDALCYRPTSTRTSMESATIHFHRDGHRHILTGCRGTVDFDYSVGKYGVAKFEITGIYNAPTDQSLPSPTYPGADITPPVVINAGLQIASIDMDLTAVNALSLRLGNTVNLRRDINAATGLVGLEITDRNPTGSVDPEAVDLSDFNPWTAWENATEQKIYCDIGDTAGNQIHPYIPRALYEEASYADRDGLVVYSLPFTAKGGDEGDDEFWLFFY
jgi:hypothetical protein